MLALIRCCVLLALCSHAAGQSRLIKQLDREVEIVVQDGSTPERAQQLLDWAQEYVRAAHTSSGSLPLRRARVEIREIDSDDRSPVPWGQTLREKAPVKVLLYVRRSASIQELRADWTAPHELAHLHHPFLGRSGRWLAEGWASYSQHRYMARAGVLTVEQAWEKLVAGFGRGAASTQTGPITTLSHRGGGTMRIYWGGAAFWLTLDLRLRERGLGSLDALMDRYSACCMQGEIYRASESTQAEARALEFLQALEQLHNGKAEILALYREHVALESFAELDAQYRALGLRQDAGELKFDRDPSHRRLRRELMFGRAP